MIAHDHTYQCPDDRCIVCFPVTGTNPEARTEAAQFACDVSGALQLLERAGRFVHEREIQDDCVLPALRSALEALGLFQAFAIEVARGAR